MKPLLSTAAQRIASGTVASDEIITSILSRRQQLGRIVALSSLVDDPRYSNMVMAAKQIPGRVGQRIEDLLRLRPDLVILASFNRTELFSQLSEAGIPLYRMDGFASLADISRHIRELGKRLGEDQAAAEVLVEFQAEQQQFAAAMKKAKEGGAVLTMLNWQADGLLWGSATLFDSMLAMLSCENLAAQAGVKGWARLSDEVLASLKPEWLIIPGEAQQRDEILAELAAKPALAQMPAVTKQQIILVPPAELQAFSPAILKAMAKIVAPFLDSL